MELGAEAGGVLVLTGTSNLNWSAASFLAFAAKARLVIKNKPAKTAVVRVKKFAEPAAPNTVPAAPAPKEAPASAPLPC